MENYLGACLCNQARVIWSPSFCVARNSLNFVFSYSTDCDTINGLACCMVKLAMSSFIKSKTFMISLKSVTRSSRWLWSMAICCNKSHETVIESFQCNMVSHTDWCSSSYKMKLWTINESCFLHQKENFEINRYIIEIGFLPWFFKPKLSI